MENIKKCSKSDRGGFPRGGISILHAIDMNKCENRLYIPDRMLTFRRCGQEKIIITLLIHTQTVYVQS